MQEVDNERRAQDRAQDIEFLEGLDITNLTSVEIFFAWRHSDEAGSRRLAALASASGYVTYVKSPSERLPDGWLGGGSVSLLAVDIEVLTAHRENAWRLCAHAGARLASFGVMVEPSQR